MSQSWIYEKYLILLEFSPKYHKIVNKLFKNTKHPNFNALNPTNFLKIPLILDILSPKSPNHQKNIPNYRQNPSNIQQIN